MADREMDILRRRLERHVKWGEAAREMARDMLSGDGIARMVAEGWWRQQLDMPRVVHSLADVRAAAKEAEDATGNMRPDAELGPGTPPNQTPAPLRSDEP